MNLIIKENLLPEFCKLNNFVIITDDILKDNNMYKNIVYATNNNFVGKSVYPSYMPIIMNDEVWNKLVKVNNELKTHNLCICIYDAYRPIEVQKMFWNEFYNQYGYNDETLVANPNKYGTHNIKINAIDMFITNIDGTYLELPCEFDDFSKKANIHYEDCSSTAKQNRDLLINTCNRYGLIVNEDEWWHYYDNRLNDYGMRFNYKESDLIPINEDKVFILED